MSESARHQISDRFRGFLPVIVDVETGGFVAATDAILEIAATTVRMDEDGVLAVHRTHDFHIQPFEGANIEQSALDFTGIDPWHPFRQAVPEAQALDELFRVLRKEIRDQSCTRTADEGQNNLQWPDVRTSGAEDLPCTEGIVFADALLEPLADNGGPTRTMALGDGSPALGAGTDCPGTDQRGEARDSGSCDLGAFESQ